MIKKKIYLKAKRSNNLDKTIRDVTYIILSPGISFQPIEKFKKII